MTQEDKELLLKDLCGRLPYGVKCRFETTTDTYQTIEFSREGTNGVLVDFDELHCYWFNEGFILPYLRPMSSMTEKEKKEYYELYNYEKREYNQGCNFYDEFKVEIGDEVRLSEVIDWLNSHHFDYRGLIEKGFALPAPPDMYKF